MLLSLWKQHAHHILISSEQGSQEWQVGIGAASHFWRMFLQGEEFAQASLQAAIC